VDILANAKTAQDVDTAEQALSALCQRLPDAGHTVTQVKQTMAKVTPEKKAALVRVLGSIGGTAGLEAVRQAATEPQPEVRAAAVRTLSDWSDPKVAPELLAMARSTGNQTERMLLLRGYLRIAGSADLPEPERLGMCKEASRLAAKSDEKKLLLGALGGLNSPEAFSTTIAYIDDEDVRAEAGAAALNIAERLVKGEKAAENAPSLVEPLEQIGRKVESLSSRANRLAEEARKKAKAS
jgi:hypothetical protein